MQTGGDADLVIAARSGDREALSRLLSRHRPQLLAICRRALGDAGLAEDAVQEACLQAYLGLERLRDPERFGSWLFGIGLNCCHRLRRQRLHEAWSWDAMQGGVLHRELVDAGPEPADLAAAADLHAAIARAVAGLPVRQQAAARLHYLSGLTQAETAEALGIAPGAVKTRLHNARTRLRQELAPQAEWWLGARGEEARMDTDLVEMQVVDVRRRKIDELQEYRYFVMLQERDGERHLPIWIGQFEAIAMSLTLERVPNTRPLTYTFAADLFRAAGGQVREARIDRLEENVFYATVVTDGPGGERLVDARPSDALNIALVMGVPIRASSIILDAMEETVIEDWAPMDERTEGAAVIAASIAA
jgi:RNA polymerase sigma factor (sigma-70 family)